MNCRLLGIAFRSALICAASAFALIALSALLLWGLPDPKPWLLPLTCIPLFLGAVSAGILTARAGEGNSLGGGLIGGGAYAILILLTSLSILLNDSDHVQPDFIKLTLTMLLLPMASLLGVWLVGRKQRMISAHSRKNAVRNAVRRAGMSGR